MKKSINHELLYLNKFIRHLQRQSVELLQSRSDENGSFMVNLDSLEIKRLVKEFTDKHKV